MIQEYLSQKTLVQSVSTVEELEERVKSGKPLNILMGQTFDDGQPVDMMKYALFMMNLGDLLAKDGIETSINWLIADHFITDINHEGEATQVREQVKKRIAYLQYINDVYGSNIGVVLSSELSQRSEYKKNLAVLMLEAERNKTFRDVVLRAVPEDRRDNPDALHYPFEELATVQTLDTNIKVGPPYEVFYDQPAREFAPMVGFNRYVAIHLTRGFPFGNPEISLKTAEEIESFGILPYKKGSKGLGEYRIDPIDDDLEKTRKLIDSTRDTRAILDLLVIVEQAKLRLERSKNASFFAGDEQEKYRLDLHTPQARDLVFRSYERFIYNPLNSI